MLDALGDLLNPYSELIGAAAGLVATLQSVSGAVFLNDIRKRGSADGFDPMPFIGGIVITILALKLSLILGASAMIRTNIIGLVINVIYMSFFYAYTSKEARPKIWKQMGIGAAFAFTCVTYATFEDPEKIEARFGMLITAMFVVLIGAPLLKMGEIIKKKSAENLPFPMILTGTLMGVLWLTYAISIKNRTVIYQNGFMLILSLPQLILCLIYPRTPTKVKASDKETKKD
ncbi:sugar transporter SWEET1-like [Eupeodes corollae]|uniref:sugar transporter SWEET1-like n=1 Tax=Eupeodes corollae TaxID=290404 RepID=UPI0024923209|nr:sugar transporter SWEET1-like [Eupeodes corollae]